MAALKRIPCGVESWDEIREPNMLYVDKTEQILKVIALYSNICYFRPRRFGKTILASTIADLFLNGDKNFQNTAIYGNWLYDTNFKVLNVSFVGVSGDNPKELEANMCGRIALAYAKADYSEANSIALSQIQTFNQLLPYIQLSCKGKKLAVLVDEWDYPISIHLNDEEHFNSALTVIGKFFSGLRAMQPAFMFVTGIMRYSNASLLTGNSFYDLSMDPDFANLLGYNQHEVEYYFREYITEAAKRLRMSEGDVLDKIKLYYDGYCFDAEAETKLYCPVSINSFFAQLQSNNKPPQFKSFWTETSNTAAALRSYLKSHPVDISLLEHLFDHGALLPYRALSTASSFNEMQLVPLLAQCGLLSIKEKLQPASLEPHQDESAGASAAESLVQSESILRSDLLYKCALPNMEVQNGYVDALINYLISPSTEGQWLPAATTSLANALATGDIAKTADWLNELLVESILCDKKAPVEESYYRDFIKTFFRFKLRARVETANSVGRSDLEVRVGDMLYIFELKRTSSETKRAIRRKLDSAEKQIDKNAYGISDANHDNNRGVSFVAVVFVISDKSRQIVAWRSIDQNDLHKEGFVTAKSMRNSFI